MDLKICFFFLFILFSGRLPSIYLFLSWKYTIKETVTHTHTLINSIYVRSICTRKYITKEQCTIHYLLCNTFAAPAYFWVIKSGVVYKQNKQRKYITFCFLFYFIACAAFWVCVGGWNCTLHFSVHTTLLHHIIFYVIYTEIWCSTTIKVGINLTLIVLIHFRKKILLFLLLCFVFIALR